MSVRDRTAPTPSQWATAPRSRQTSRIGAAGKPQDLCGDRAAHVSGPKGGGSGSGSGSLASQQRSSSSNWKEMVREVGDETADSVTEMKGPKGKPWQMHGRPKVR